MDAAGIVTLSAIADGTKKLQEKYDFLSPYNQQRHHHGYYEKIVRGVEALHDQAQMYVSIAQIHNDNVKEVLQNTADVYIQEAGEAERLFQKAEVEELRKLKVNDKVSNLVTDKLNKLGLSGDGVAAQRRLFG